MAQGPYTGVPEVQPDGSVPDSYQHIHANPSAFGAEIAEGAQKVGQGLSKAGEFYGQVSADNASNEYQTKVDKILHGDPTTMGPDGQPVKGFLALKGQAATDAWPGVSKQLEEERKVLANTMQTPDQQQRFDNASKRYHSYATNQVGQHADSQYNAWYTDVENSSAKNAMTHIANNYNNEEEVKHGYSDLMQARLQTAQRMGAKPGDAVWNATVQTAKQEALTTRLEAMAVHDPAGAMRKLEENREIAGTRYDDLATKFRSRNDQQIGRGAGASFVAQARQAQTVSFAQNAPAGEASKSLLRDVEGFRPAAYWDVNHWRAGYGSDTITKADGTVVPVTQGTVITKEDAERDLERRTRDVEGRAKVQIGQNAWDKLTPQAKAAISSIGYNYGQLPGSVVQAAQSGNLDVLSQAVLNLSADNGGVNATRRQTEAALISGRSTQAAKQGAFRLALDDTSLSPEQRNYALHEITTQLNAQEVADNQSARARTQSINDAVGGYTTRFWNMLHSPNPNWVEFMGEINRDPRLADAGPAKDGLMERIIKRSGEEQSLSFGPGYTDIKRRILSEPGSEGHMADISEIYKLPLGQLTAAGEHQLVQIASAVKKSPDQYGIQRTKQSLEQYAKGKLSFDQELLIPGVPQSMARDPKGEQIFNAQFIPMFEAAYGKWVADGKPPYEFLTQTNVDKLILGMRSSREMAEERMRATNNLGEVQAPPAMPKGANVDPEAWKKMTGVPAALADGTPLTKIVWANALATLATNPTKASVEGFNRVLGRDDGAAILKQLTGKDLLAPAAPPAAAEPAKPPRKSYSIHDQQGPGPAGYLGDLLREIVPQRVQDYVGKIDSKNR